MTRGPTEHEGAISSLRLRLGLVLALRRALVVAAACGFGTGLWILAARAARLVPPPRAAWAAWGIAAALLLSLPGALARVPSRRELRALLDARSACGGLLLASETLDLGAWRADLAAPARLRVRWNAGRRAGVLALAIAFAALAALLPARAAAARRALDVDRQIARASSELAALGEAEALEPRREEELAKRLEELSREAAGNDPERTWEALDHIEETVQSAARGASEGASASAERLAQAERLAAGLAAEAKDLPPGELSAAMDELTRRVEAALGGAKALAATDALPEDVKKALREGSLDAGRLAKLGAALSASKEARLDALRKLHRAGLVDERTLRRAEARAEKGDTKGLAAYLAEHKGDVSGACASYCERPGSGGVNRGRGDAPLTSQAPPEGAKLDEKVLPPAEVDALKRSETLATTSATPEAAKTADAPTGALASARAGGGSAAAQPVLPRHRAAVRRYFERP